MASVTKTHDTWSEGQFLTGSLTHFTIAHASIVIKDLVEAASMRATVVLVGDGGARIAVENNGAWTAATLQTELGAGWTVTDFVY
jgi:hypothetical protein